MRYILNVERLLVKVYKVEIKVKNNVGSVCGRVCMVNKKCQYYIYPLRVWNGQAAVTD